MMVTVRVSTERGESLAYVKDQLGHHSIRSLAAATTCNLLRNRRGASGGEAGGK